MKTFKVILGNHRIADVFMNELYVGTFSVDDIRDCESNESIIGASFSDDDDFAFKGMFKFRFEGTTIFHGTGKMEIFDCRKMTTEQTNKIFMNVAAGKL